MPVGDLAADLALVDSNLNLAFKPLGVFIKVLLGDNLESAVPLVSLRRMVSSRIRISSTVTVVLLRKTLRTIALICHLGRLV